MKKNNKPGKNSFKVAKPTQNVSGSRAWTMIVIVLSFVLSVIFSAIATVLLSRLDILWAFFILLAIIVINILFDIIGTATQTAEESPFHSLSSRKVKGAAESVMIIRHAPQISNMCCDCMGDIAGIISGAVTTLIVAELVAAFGWEGILPSLILTGIVSSLTIGGKAFFKVISIRNSNHIVLFMGRIISFFMPRR
ncbi:MAG: hypothetical protein J6N52_04280 [Clostridia bacterium]|nr:hypothetical protein [Clostridia bacterium]